MKSVPRHTFAWEWIVFILVISLRSACYAQNLGYEGPTGIFVTPTASVVSSESKNLGKPVVAYHFLNGGDVIGTYSTISVTDGAF